ncbi:glycoside hydrolase family 43 protein [Klebsiella sp. BIGb0407]|uniref:glycoside hydrolase family 43 protein n=1 Tax=Klebsiella sp. BIGb0407 TaxID=2940603 RepID=UPI0021696293|nr:glycoside hydrolase family 43 protein [Klebsiella sp. BIGb0407]MCS3430198.1 xylan 1,4-beta-xylosidase [Klebsiella sp. BIGb0407]
MIQNPIFKGFNPDPCICRKGDDYYVAVSSFEWFPGIPVYHSRDLKNWQLLTHVLSDDLKPNLRNLPSAKGVWAPSLTWCEAEECFYVIYGVMNSMNSRYFDVDNYLITAKEITGPWSEPVYLHSAGFDASILHDTDGRKWIVSLEWETRPKYEKPGAICLVEYSPTEQSIVGLPQRIWHGGTDRGCIEAPHLTRRGDYYYLMTAEGGTGYGHAVTMGRAKNVRGPYESDPQNPILTSWGENFNERHDANHLKPHYFNPETYLQKAGHGSYIDTPEGEVYLVHLCSRPFREELCCTLGRETAIQEMEWTADNWLRLKGGGNIARHFVNESNLPFYPFPVKATTDDFDQAEFDVSYYSPRIDFRRFASLQKCPGSVTLTGQESLSSTHSVSLLAKKLTSVYSTITTKLTFSPQIYQHSAGLVLYYDNMNYLFLHQTWQESTAESVLSVIHINNGQRHDISIPVPITQEPVYLQMRIEGREITCYWSYSDGNFKPIGEYYDTRVFSDEHSQYGEFTGAFFGLACVDSMTHQKEARFDFLRYEADETRLID